MSGWTRDGDGSPVYVGTPREEPLCGSCCDRGTVPGRLYGRRPCPDCRRPDPLDRLVRWVPLLRLRWRYRRDDGAPFDDRPPF